MKELEVIDYDKKKKKKQNLWPQKCSCIHELVVVEKASTRSGQGPVKILA